MKKLWSYATKIYEKDVTGKEMYGNSNISESNVSVRSSRIFVRWYTT